MMEQKSVDNLFIQLTVETDDGVCIEAELEKDTGSYQITNTEDPKIGELTLKSGNTTLTLTMGRQDLQLLSRLSMKLADTLQGFPGDLKK